MTVTPSLINWSESEFVVVVVVVVVIVVYWFVCLEGRGNKWPEQVAREKHTHIAPFFWS